MDTSYGGGYMYIYIYIYIILLLTYTNPLAKYTIMFVNNYRKLLNLCVCLCLCVAYPVSCVYPLALPDKRTYWQCPKMWYIIQSCSVNRFGSQRQLALMAAIYDLVGRFYLYMVGIYHITYIEMYTYSAWKYVIINAITWRDCDVRRATNCY